MQDRQVTYREIEASFSTGLMNSIVADAHSKTTIVLENIDAVRVLSFFQDDIKISSFSPKFRQ